jgi:lipopolysaccharide transport system ATP-binding protein
MDEWLSVGDEGFKQKAEDRLTSLVDSSKILVIASHSRDMIEKICTRVIWLEHGQVKMDGPAKQVTEAYKEVSAKVQSNVNQIKNKYNNMKCTNLLSLDF